VIETAANATKESAERETSSLKTCLPFCKGAVQDSFRKELFASTPYVSIWTACPIVLLSLRSTFCNLCSTASFDFLSCACFKCPSRCEHEDCASIQRG
jgi:hypothetical protein